MAGGTAVVAEKSDLAGVSRVFNGLEPGVTVRYFYGGTASSTLLMGGHELILQTAHGTLTSWCRWGLPSTTLAAGSSYLLSLRGSSVVVETVG